MSKKPSNKLMLLIAISLVGTIIFGLIDSTFFLFFESNFQKDLLENKRLDFDPTMAEILTGAISAAFAVFFASFMKGVLKSKYQIIENPFLDAIGILIGALIVLFIYYQFKSHRNSSEKDNHTDLR